MTSKGQSIILEDFSDGKEFASKIESMFESFSKNYAHNVDRYYLTGLSRLSYKKKKKITKWIEKEMKNKKVVENE